MKVPKFLQGLVDDAGKVFCTPLLSVSNQDRDAAPPIRSIRKIQELMAEDAKEIARMRGIMEADAIWWENEAKTYQDVINTQKQTINQLRQKVGSDGKTLATITDERDRLHGLLSVADCPHCGGTAKDCEWCDGRKYCMEPRN